MKAHRVNTTVNTDGSVTVGGLPFSEGEVVQVIVLPKEPETTHGSPAPLENSVRRYEAPFEPVVDENEWEAT